MGYIVFSILLGGVLVPTIGFILVVLTRTDLFEGRGFIYLWIMNSITVYLWIT